jgi:hypothetical protein
MNMSQNNSVRAYFCGGAGANIGKVFIGDTGKKEPGFAIINPVFIDNSTANMTAGMDESNFFIPDKTGSGSGGVRSTNEESNDDAVNKVLSKFQPMDFNLVIHACGGSGSSIGPMIVHDLIERGENVIVVVIGSCDSEIWVRNTMSVLMQYDNYAHTLEKPVMVSYHENGKKSSRGEVDKNIQATITYLLHVLSGDHKELDFQDCVNWVNYTTPTKYEPTITSLQITLGNKPVIDTNQFMVSALVLAQEYTTEDYRVRAPYWKAGLVPENQRPGNDLKMSYPIYFANVIGYFEGVLASLKEERAAYAETQSTVVVKSIVDKKVKTTGKRGMVEVD